MGLGGYLGGCIPGTIAKASLRLIYRILESDRFIRPFDCELMNIYEI